MHDDFMYSSLSPNTMFPISFFLYMGRTDFLNIISLKLWPNIGHNLSQIEGIYAHIEDARETWCHYLTLTWERKFRTSLLNTTTIDITQAPWIW
jgi:hypothetical protein